MTTYLLVHGAFRGGWAWGPVRNLLESHGHRVLAPSLVGCGELAGVPAPTLEVWVDQLAGLLRLEDLRDVVVLAHSMGGLPVTALAARGSDRIAHVAYLDAPEPLPGQRGIDLGPGAPTDPADLPPRDTVLRPTGEDDRLGPTPLGPSLDPLTSAPALPRSYAFCRSTPPGYPCEPTRRRLEADGLPYALLDSDHDAPLTAPALVVEWLLATTDRVAA